MKEVKILFLNNKDMYELGAHDMEAALKDDEQIYSLYSKGETIIPSKVVLRFGKTIEDEAVNGRINAMPGYAGGPYDIAGIKWIGSGPQNYKKGLPRASVLNILNDIETKLPVCIADGTVVSAKRTGAAGGTGIKYLSKKTAKTMTICGAGAQSRTQLEAAKIVRPTIKKVYIYDLFFDRAEAFADEMGKKYSDLEIIPVKEEGLPEAVADSDIVDTVTLADRPIIQAEWLSKGTLLVQMAGYEATYECAKKADKIVVDFWGAVKHRMASTLAFMWRDGELKDTDITAEVGQIINGEKPGRENDDEIIYYNTVGAGVLDLAITYRCYKKALEEKKGLWIPYWVEY